VATIGFDAACRLWNNMLPKGHFAKLFTDTLKTLGLEKLQAYLAKIFSETVEYVFAKIPFAKDCIVGGLNSAEGAALVVDSGAPSFKFDGIIGGW